MNCGTALILLAGSSLHAVRALTYPRWEDYNFEPLDGIKNRFYWLGDGSTVADQDENGDSEFVSVESGRHAMTLARQRLSTSKKSIIHLVSERPSHS